MKTPPTSALRLGLTALFALTLTSSIADAKRYMGRRIDLSFKQAELTQIFRLLSDVGGRNLVLSHGVKAKVDIQLKNTPWDKVLDDLVRRNGLKTIKIGPALYICPAAEAKKKLRFKPLWPVRRSLRGDLRLRGVRVDAALRLVLVDELRTVLVDPRLSGLTTLKLRNVRRNEMLAALLRKEGLELTALGKTIRIFRPGATSGLVPLKKAAAPRALAAKGLRLRGVLRIGQHRPWALVEDKGGKVALLRRGDRVGDRTVRRILREVVILRHASDGDMDLQLDPKPGE